MNPFNKKQKKFISAELYNNLVVPIFMAVEMYSSEKMGPAHFDKMLLCFNVTEKIRKNTHLPLLRRKSLNDLKSILFELHAQYKQNGFFVYDENIDYLMGKAVVNLCNQWRFLPEETLLYTMLDVIEQSQLKNAGTSQFSKVVTHA